MEEKFYQVKDIMDMFGITRDAIKYYEKKGLIEPSRTETGYRLFDSFNVEKLKKILDLRDLGFSIKEVIEMSEDAECEKNAVALTALRKETEKSIRELNKKLEKIRSYERTFFESKRFSQGFNVEYDVSFCIDCPLLSEQDKCSFFVRQVNILSLNTDGSVEREKESYIVLGDTGLKDECQGCDKKRTTFKYVYRGVFPYEGKEELCKVIQRAYKNASMEGYVLQNQVYLTQKVLTRKEGERLFIDIRIPIES